MKYFYNIARLPDEKKYIDKINRAAESLKENLMMININSLNISDYNKWYFSENIKHIHGLLKLYTYLLSWSLSNCNDIKNYVFIDYGGGWGMMSLLAKEVGIGTVIYNDIYDISCYDARVIAHAINKEADHYITGDLSELVSFTKKNAISCNSIVSNNVIEHIYDIEHHLRCLSELSDDNLSVVMASDANMHNQLIRNKLMQKQRQMEYNKREENWGHKKRDSLEPYFYIRKGIIKEFLPSISDSEADMLAKATRGMILDDIKKCLTTFKNTGKIPEGLSHPTNTCDPYTGNWAEHLMDTNYLKYILTEEQFNVRILGGYYGAGSNNLLEKITANILNYILYILNSKNLIFAPYYIIYANTSEKH